MKIANAKKYLKFLEESKSKIVLLRKLSLGTNILEDVILDEFSEFDPLIRMIDNTNFKKYIPDFDIDCVRINREGLFLENMTEIC